MPSRQPQGRPLPWFDLSDLLVLLAWGSLLMKYWITGELAVLLHPDYQWLSHTAAILLLGLTALKGWRLWAQSWQSPRRPLPALAQHVTLMPHRWSRGILLAVAVAGLIYSPRPFSSDTALQRGLTDTLSMTRSRPQAFVRQTTPAERTIIDWVRTLHVYPEPDAYSGDAVDVTGFVIHPPDWPASHLMLARFVLTCCAADAYPVGLAVRLPAGQSAPAADTWLRVTGQMTTETLNAQRQLVIAPERWQQVEQPANPYEY